MHFFFAKIGSSHYKVSRLCRDISVFNWIFGCFFSNGDVSIFQALSFPSGFRLKAHIAIFGEVPQSVEEKLVPEFPGKSLYKPYNTWVFMGNLSPRFPRLNTINTMGPKLLGVHPIVP